MRLAHVISCIPLQYGKHNPINYALGNGVYVPAAVPGCWALLNGYINGYITVPNLITPKQITRLDILSEPNLHYWTHVNASRGTETISVPRSRELGYHFRQLDVTFTQMSKNWHNEHSSSFTYLINHPWNELYFLAMHMTYRKLVWPILIMTLPMHCYISIQTFFTHAVEYHYFVKSCANIIVDYGLSFGNSRTE